MFKNDSLSYTTQPNALMPLWKFSERLGREN
jgi:hypothetical protein